MTSPWKQPDREDRDHRLPPPVTVGTPCTYGLGSDRYAMVVVAVRRKRREIEAAGLDGGMHRTFTWRPGAAGPWAKAVKTRRRWNIGRYVMKGAEYGTLHLGRAENYRDPSF